MLWKPLPLLLTAPPATTTILLGYEFANSSYDVPSSMFISSSDMLVVGSGDVTNVVTTHKIKQPSVPVLRIRGPTP